MYKLIPMQLSWTKKWLVEIKTLCTMLNMFDSTVLYSYSTDSHIKKVKLWRWFHFWNQPHVVIWRAAVFGTCVLALEAAAWWTIQKHQLHPPHPHCLIQKPSLKLQKHCTLHLLWVLIMFHSSEINMLCFFFFFFAQVGINWSACREGGWVFVYALCWHVRAICCIHAECMLIMHVCSIYSLCMCHLFSGFRRIIECIAYHIVYFKHGPEILETADWNPIVFICSVSTVCSL